MESRTPGNYQSRKTNHEVSNVNTREQSDNSDSDEVGLIVQHALSADASNQLANMYTDWIIDLGATCHVCHDCSLFTELESLEQSLYIILGDGGSLNATALPKHACLVLLSIKVTKYLALPSAF